MTQTLSKTWSIRTQAGLGAAGEVACRELTEAINTAGDEIGRQNQAGRLIYLSLEANDLSAEGYRITSGPKEGRLMISCSGWDKQGLIYAAYDLAERIRYREPLEKLDVKEEPYFTMRRIFVLWPDHKATGRLIQAMPRWRMNALCLYGACHAPAHRSDNLLGYYDHYLSLPISYRNYPQVNATISSSTYFQEACNSFTKLLETARDHEVDTYVIFSVLQYVHIDNDGPHWGSDVYDYFPELFIQGQEGNKLPDWDSPPVWKFISDQLEELFELYPDLTGILLSSDEMTPYNLGHLIWHTGGKDEERKNRIIRLVETVEAICTRYGKRCYWYVHGCGMFYINTLVELGRNRQGGLRLCCESGPFEAGLADNYPRNPYEKLAEAGDGMFDLDGVIQYFQTFPWLPNILDRYIIRHVSDGIKTRLRGGGVFWWLEDPCYSPLNSLSAANMELFSRLLWNPEESIDTIWERWLCRRFGKCAKEAAGYLLRSTQEIINGIFYYNNTNDSFQAFSAGLLFLQNDKPALEFLMQPEWGQMVEYFQPAGTPLYSNCFNAYCRERTISMAQIRSEKQEAVQKAQHLLEYVTEHKIDFAEKDYFILLPRYLALFYFARATAQVVEMLYNFTNLHIRAYDPDCQNPRTGMEQAMSKLEKLHIEILADKRLLYFEPDVYVYGLCKYFIDHIPAILTDLLFFDRVLSTPEIVHNLPEAERERAECILSHAVLVREKFERNARGEVIAEEEWARLTYGELNYYNATKSC